MYTWIAFEIPQDLLLPTKDFSIMSTASKTPPPACPSRGFFDHQWLTDWLRTVQISFAKVLGFLSTIHILRVKAIGLQEPKDSRLEFFFGENAAREPKPCQRFPRFDQWQVEFVDFLVFYSLELMDQQFETFNESASCRESCRVTQPAFVSISSLLLKTFPKNTSSVIRLKSFCIFLLAHRMWDTIIQSHCVCVCVPKVSRGVCLFEC